MENEKTFGTLMENFISTYIPENRKQIAMLELQFIVIKAQRASMVEVAKIYQPS